MYSSLFIGSLSNWLKVPEVFQDPSQDPRRCFSHAHDAVRLPGPRHSRYCTPAAARAAIRASVLVAIERCVPFVCEVVPRRKARLAFTFMGSWATDLITGMKGSDLCSVGGICCVLCAVRDDASWTLCQSYNPIHTRWDLLLAKGGTKA